MAAKISPAPLSYSQAADALGSKSRRTIGHNTELVRNGETEIVATYHGNKIVRYSKDGVFASWAGWATSTTRDRLNQLTTGRFNIKNREPHVNGEPVSAYDWVEIH
jgi:hypothetical protein